MFVLCWGFVCFCFSSVLIVGNQGSLAREKFLFDPVQSPASTTCPVFFFSVSPCAAPGAERERNALARGGAGCSVPGLTAALPASRPSGVQAAASAALPTPSTPRQPTPAPAPAFTCIRKRCTVVSMVSRPARCLCRALAAAPRAVRRPVHRRTTAADTKQQARATPETPVSAVHTWLGTMISRTDCFRREESARATQQLRCKTRPGSPASPPEGGAGGAASPRGARGCRAARKAGSSNGQGQAWPPAGLVPGIPAF